MIKYARKCSECGCGMNEGFVVDEGDNYYCSEDCLYENFTPEEWLEKSDEHYDDDNIPIDCLGSYWTEWDTEDEDEMEWVEIDGVLEPNPNYQQ